jgi:hypothetical protein
VSSSQTVASGSVGSNGKAPDACTFIPRDELAKIVNYQLQDGVPEHQQETAGSSACQFRRMQGLHVSTTYPNPVLKQAGFESVVVAVGPMTPSDFKNLRGTIGSEGEDVNGVGDAAFFWGPLLYVRVGNVSFSVRLHTSSEPQPLGPDEAKQAKDIALQIARNGVAKLS